MWVDFRLERLVDGRCCWVPSLYLPTSTDLTRAHIKRYASWVTH